MSLARPRRTGHQHYAVRLIDHLSPDPHLLRREAEAGEILHGNVRIEDAQHQFLAEGRGQRGDTQFDLLAVGRASANAAVLGTASFGDVQPAENFDAAGDGGHHRARELVNVVQVTIDPKAHVAGIAARLDMDVAGTRVKGVLQQPVDDGYDVVILGRELSRAAELGELLEIAYAAGRDP